MELIRVTMYRRQNGPECPHEWVGHFLVGGEAVTVQGSEADLIQAVTTAYRAYRVDPHLNVEVGWRDQSPEEHSMLWEETTCQG